MDEICSIVGSCKNELGNALKKQLKSSAIADVLEQLKRSPAGLDSSLRNSVSFGIAYHHAGNFFRNRRMFKLDYF
jgi:DNA polymerase theta